MSKLLIEEQPLQVQPSLAAALGGADEAIVLQQLHYWLSRTNNVKEDGHKWIYNSMSDWMKQFPWIKSRSRLTRYFDDLEKRGLIVTGNFNKAKFDKTKWYRIDYDALTDFEQRLYQNESTSDSKQVNGMSRNESTYTNRLPETTTREDDDDARARKTDQPNEDPVDIAKKADINVDIGPHKLIFNDFTRTLGSPLVCWAVHRTLDKAHHPNWDYLLTTLKDLEANSVRTVEQAEKLSEEHKQKAKQNYRGRSAPQVHETMPDWDKQDEATRTKKASASALAKARARQAKNREAKEGATS